MKFLSQNYRLLLRRIALLMYVFFLARLLFLIFNYSYFSSSGFNAILSGFFFGLRFDITAIVISNILFISMHLFDFQFFYTKIYQLILKSLFLIVNIPFLLLSCIDVGLFRFTGKRSGMEIFSIMSFGNDFVNTLPKMVSDFWYLLLIFFALVILLIRSYPTVKSKMNISINPGKSKFKSAVKRILLFLLFFLVTFIGFRGGIQLKPLNILAASRYGISKTSSLVLNTPFTIIKTYGKERVDDIHWMTDDKAIELSPVNKTSTSSIPFNPKNVVVIILESFGKEYIGSLNSDKGYTPFLDSLIGQSLVFPNAYANGKRSIEGIPAIVAGIPSLINDPFITSAYSGNSITTLPSLLKLKGYNSCFYHGGTNGTMGFDNFSKLSGFDNYFGRTEYKDDEDFDGSWGIYDEPFLQRIATEINMRKTPFMATIFTLSSHHPFKIPEKYENVFPEGTLAIHQSIRYADYSLKRFFETASEMPWFRNTLFVITADHTALSEKEFYRNRVGLFSVPVLFYCPSDSLLKGTNMKATQQIDILPSVLDYLGYDQPFFSLGNSVFDKAGNGFAINFVDGSYQLIEENYSFVMDTLNKNSLFRFDVDSALKNNLVEIDSLKEKTMELKLKSVLQNYYHALIHNEMN